MAISGDGLSTVFVVDDDEAVRHAMELLMRSVGLACETFPSADDFLARIDNERGGCLVLDIRMPGQSGLELQEKLIRSGNSLPIIFITGHGDVPMAVQAMQKGAIDFVQKPARDQDLLDRITRALEVDSRRRGERAQKSDIAARVKSLTRREREVLDLVVTGKANKVIAFELGVSQRTVEIHRARVMAKMQARSLADLVRMHLNR
jgi:FixJ family two-component response regulator